MKTRIFLALLFVVFLLASCSKGEDPMKKELNRCKGHFVRLLLNCQTLYEVCQPCLKENDDATH